jgi:hypothetical protein
VTQEMISLFSPIMTWIILLLCLLVVVLAGISACHLPQDRPHALLGVIAMALVVGSTAMSQVLLLRKAHSLARLLLPLASPLLMLGLYRLCFPSLAPAQTNPQLRQLLLLFTLGGFLTTAGLILLDLVFF